MIKNEQVATELAEPATWLTDELEMTKTFLIIAPLPSCANLMREILIRGGDDGSAGIFRCR
jgi:hypothetical protein